MWGFVVLGVYSFFNSGSIKGPGQRAVMISPKLPQVPRCLRFEYNVHGRDVGELVVRDSFGSVIWRHIGMPQISKT